MLAAACAAQAQQPGHIEARLSSVEGGSPELDASLDRWKRNDVQEQARNRVLNEMEAGTAAFLRGYFRHAEVLFSDAQQQIETIYADNPAAEAARSKFVPESNKEFKGDPYERAMVGYYLGLIDLARGEYDNARAGFRFAQLQDTMSASETYQDDMALMQYLVGWAYWCEGNPQQAKEEFRHAQATRPGLPLPAPGDNLLMIAELGNAPVKVTSGKYNELLGYREGAVAPEQQVAFSVDGKITTARLAEDLYFQASTRGGSAVESIRAGKASFREGAETIANAAAGIGKTALGASLLTKGKTSRDMLKVGLVAGLANVVSDSVARSTETAADARAWTSLPATIHIATARLDSGHASVEAGFFAADGKVLQSRAMRKMAAPDGTCTLAYARPAPASGVWASGGPAKWRTMPALAGVLATTQTPAAPEEVEISEEGQALLDMVRMMRTGN